MHLNMVKIDRKSFESLRVELMVTGFGNLLIADQPVKAVLLSQKMKRSFDERTSFDGKFRVSLSIRINPCLRFHFRLTFLAYTLGLFLNWFNQFDHSICFSE